MNNSLSESNLDVSINAIKCLDVDEDFQNAENNICLLVAFTQYEKFGKASDAENLKYVDLVTG